MGWDLYGSKLPDGAKAYLSALSSHGDEERARKECEVTAADVARWSRDNEFIDHRRQALAHFEGWRDWNLQEAEEDARRWPFGRRLDKLFDPFRRGTREPDASPDYLETFKQATTAIGVAKDAEQAPPGGQRFVAIEDLTPVQAAMAAAQQRTRAPQQAGGLKPNPASFPWPTHTDGTPMACQRGATSGVPGVDAPTNKGDE